ncbi:MAG: hypothetical protein ACTS3F_12715 [Phycisphaerales bacterium]
MQRRQWRALLALNAGLLVLLALVTAMPNAGAAQDQRGARQRGDYAMIGARVQGIAESAVFIVDSANQDMVALRYDQSSKSMTPLGYRNIAADGRQASGGRGGR